MRRDSIFTLEWCSVRKILFPIFAVFLYLLIFPAVTLCATWEQMGPDGGNFIFSMTNPEDANEITAITEYPSPTNVYRSIDGGVSWNKIGEIPYSYIYDVSAFNFSTLYAITSSYCFYSTDGGVSWSEVRLPTSSGYGYRICAHPTNSRIVYAVGYYYDYRNNPITYHMVFFKSIDGGRNWSTSQFFTFDYFYPRDIAISESNPAVMYVSGVKEVGSDYGGALFQSTDGGQSWTDISSNVESQNYSYFYSVAIDPTDEEKVYIGGSYFYRSTKTGRETELSWTRSTAPHYIYAMSIDPVDPSRIYTAGYESMAISTNSGQSWNLQSNCFKSSASHIAVAPGDPSKVYISSYAGFYKSSDWGANWDKAHEGVYAARINALAVDPRLILIQNSGYLMSYGRGRNNIWEDVVTPESCGEVCDILINPENPNTVLVLEGYG